MKNNDPQRTKRIEKLLAFIHQQEKLDVKTEFYFLCFAQNGCVPSGVLNSYKKYKNMLIGILMAAVVISACSAVESAKQAEPEQKEMVQSIEQKV